MSYPSLNVQPSAPLMYPSVPVLYESYVPQYQPISQESLAANPPGYQSNDVAPPSYEQTKKLAQVDEETEKLLMLTKEIATSVLKQEVPTPYLPSRPGVNRTVYIINPIAPKPSNTYIFGSNNSVGTTTTINNQVSTGPKTKDEKEAEDKKNRAVVGLAGVALLAGATYYLGKFYEEYSLGQEKISSFIKSAANWNENRQYFDANVKNLVDTLIPAADGIIQRKRTDTIYKIACSFFIALSGSLLVAGAYLNAKELYGPAMLIGGIAAVAGLFRLGTRWSSSRDQNAAKEIVNSIAAYNKSRLPQEAPPIQ